MALSEELKRTYLQAAKEAEKKLNTFWARYRAKDAQKRKLLEEGKITEAEYKRWREGQMFTGERWKEKLDDITQVYVDADKKAREIIGGTEKNVFVKFANSTGKDIGSHVAGFSFDLYDKRTVELLLKTDPTMLPRWKINEKKDYVWNEKRVKNAVAQGIIQGESIDDIGKRLTKELSAKNADQMTMFARTAITGAQNAGRIEMLHDAQNMGIKVKKKWLATLDQRTRDAHRDLDGQVVDIDEPFIVDGKKIMYPCDPNADPSLVYNCRCTLTYVYPKYQPALKDGGRREQTTGEVIKNQMYREWDGTKKQSVPTFTERFEFTDVFSTEQQTAVKDTLDTARTKYPLPYEFDFVGDGRIPRNLPHETLWDLRDNYPELRKEFGEAAQYISIKKPNGRIERRIDIIKDDANVLPLGEMFDSLYKSHKRFEETKELSDALFSAGVGLNGTVLHEYAHAVQDYCGFFIRETPEGTAFENWVRDFCHAHPTEILSISRYAGEGLAKGQGVNPSEVWAEVFVTSFDPHHDTMAWKTANKIMQEFNKRFRHKFRGGK